jgi:hypothetical protein
MREAALQWRRLAHDSEAHERRKTPTSAQPGSRCIVIGTGAYLRAVDEDFDAAEPGARRSGDLIGRGRLALT